MTRTLERSRAARLKNEREKLGLPPLEARLNEMLASNRMAQRIGDEKLWTDDEIEGVREEIRQKSRALVVD